MSQLTPQQLPPQTPDSVVRMVTACSLALKIIEAGRWRTWNDVEEIRFDLTPDQRRVIAEHEHLIRFLRGRITKTKLREGKKRVTLTACPDCGRWGMVSTVKKPSKCNLSRECRGLIIEIQPATEDTES